MGKGYNDINFVINEDVFKGLYIYDIKTNGI